MEEKLKSDDFIIECEKLIKHMKKCLNRNKWEIPLLITAGVTTEAINLMWVIVDIINAKYITGLLTLGAIAFLTVVLTINFPKIIKINCRQKQQLTEMQDLLERYKSEPWVK